MALDESFRCDPSVFLNDLLLQRSRVDADTDRNIPFLRTVDDRLDAVGTSNIAGIDPDRVRPVFHRGDREPVIKMNIRDDRNVDGIFDRAKCFRSFHRRDRRSDDLTAGFLKLKDLRDRCGCILCPGIGHRLDRNRISTADHAGAYLYFFCMISVHCSFVCLRKAGSVFTLLESICFPAGSLPFHLNLFFSFRQFMGLKFSSLPQNSPDSTMK